MLAKFPYAIAQVLILFEINQSFDHRQTFNDPIP